jgi:hypothetical protein
MQRKPVYENLVQFSRRMAATELEENPEMEYALQEAQERTNEELETEPTERLDTQIIQLSIEQVAANISQLAKTMNGLEHAFTRVDIHEQSITHVDIFKRYQHLRILVCMSNLGFVI